MTSHFDCFEKGHQLWPLRFLRVTPGRPIPTSNSLEIYVNIVIQLHLNPGTGSREVLHRTALFSPCWLSLTYGLQHASGDTLQPLEQMTFLKPDY